MHDGVHISSRTVRSRLLHPHGQKGYETAKKQLLAQKIETKR